MVCTNNAGHRFFIVGNQILNSLRALSVVVESTVAKGISIDWAI